MISEEDEATDQKTYRLWQKREIAAYESEQEYIDYPELPPELAHASDDDGYMRADAEV